MKVIDAFWEKRNLGVSCNEIQIEGEDSTDELHNTIDLFSEVQYLVIKVPIGRIDINSELSKRGFIFIECSLKMGLHLRDALLSPLQKRISNNVSYSEMTNSDLDDLYFEIKEGIFGTDRIVLDPFFTSQQASLRYINWIKDELQKGTQVYKIINNNESLGFFTQKLLGNGIYYPFLAGMYKKYSNSGLGFLTLRKPIEEAIKRGGTRISTFISTNNQPVVRAHLQQGFNIEEIQYIFVKHNSFTR